MESKTITDCANSGNEGNKEGRQEDIGKPSH